MMQCMKCGQETDPGQVFCQDCLAEMKKYPVKPGTPVYIPNRAQITRKTPRPPAVLEPEEQLRRLRKSYRRLFRAFLVSLLALAACALLVAHLYRQDHPLPTGQDYNVPNSTVGNVSGTPVP